MMCIRQYGTTITVSFPDNKNVIAALHILAVKAARTDRFRDFCNEITVTIFRIGMKDLRSGIIKKKGIETGTQMPVSGLPAWILNSYFISGSDIWTASSRTFRNARKALSAISWSVTPGVRTGPQGPALQEFLTSPAAGLYGGAAAAILIFRSRPAMRIIYIISMPWIWPAIRSSKRAKRIRSPLFTQQRKH